MAATRTECLRSKGRPSSFHVRSDRVKVSSCEALKSDLNLRSSVGRGSLIHLNCLNRCIKPPPIFLSFPLGRPYENKAVKSVTIRRPF